MASAKSSAPRPPQRQSSRNRLRQGMRAYLNASPESRHVAAAKAMGLPPVHRDLPQNQPPQAPPEGTPESKLAGGLS